MIPYRRPYRECTAYETEDFPQVERYYTETIRLLMYTTPTENRPSRIGRSMREAVLG